MNQLEQITNKDRLRRKPVYKFIAHHVLILKVLFDGDKNVNEIFRLVKENQDAKIPYQSVKAVTIDAINDLVKNQLVHEEITPPIQKFRSKYRTKKKPIKQKRIIGLAPLGSELSSLIYFSHRYKQNYAQLKEKIDYHFNVNDDNKISKSSILRSRLERREWKDEEMGSYPSLREGILLLETHLPPVLLSALFSRCLTIIFRCSPLNNISQEILKKVIMDAITEYILHRLEGALVDKIFSNNSERENAYNLTYRLLSGWTTAHFLNHVQTFSKNRFIQSESLDLVKTLYGILNAQAGFLQNVLGREAKSDPEINQLIKVLEASRNESRKS